MDKAGLFLDTKAFLLALAYSQPRILAMFLPIPLFNRQLLPGMLRLAIGAGLGVMVAPTLMPAVAAAELSSVQVLMLVTTKRKKKHNHYNPIKRTAQKAVFLCPSKKKLMN